MRAFAVALLILGLASCDKGGTKRVVKGPLGISAEITERTHGASAGNTVEVALRSPRSAGKVKIFSGSGGSGADVIFEGKLIVVQYCWPDSYDIRSYVYSIGDDLAYSDIRIAAATTDSQIAGRRFCPTQATPR
jgi:hypothetical protein